MPTCSIFKVTSHAGKSCGLSSPDVRTGSFRFRGRKNPLPLFFRLSRLVRISPAPSPKSPDWISLSSSDVIGQFRRAFGFPSDSAICRAVLFLFCEVFGHKIGLSDFSTPNVFPVFFFIRGGFCRDSVIFPDFFGFFGDFYRSRSLKRPLAGRRAPCAAPIPACALNCEDILFSPILFSSLLLSRLLLSLSCIFLSCLVVCQHIRFSRQGRKRAFRAIFSDENRSRKSYRQRAIL